MIESAEAPFSCKLKKPVTRNPRACACSAFRVDNTRGCYRPVDAGQRITRPTWISSSMWINVAATVDIRYSKVIIRWKFSREKYSIPPWPGINKKGKR